MMHRALQRAIRSFGFNCCLIDMQTVDMGGEVAANAEVALPDENRAWADLGLSGHRLYYRWGGQLLDNLVNTREKFAGDLDQYIIFLLFVLEDLSRHTVSPGQCCVEEGGDRTSRARGLNQMSVSEITRIPRQTVRRKLHALAESGHLTRTEDGMFYLGERHSHESLFSDLSSLFWNLGGKSQIK